MIVVTEMEQQAYSEKKVEKSPWVADDRPSAPKVNNFSSQGPLRSEDQDLRVGKYEPEPFLLN